MSGVYFHGEHIFIRYTKRFRVSIIWVLVLTYTQPMSLIVVLDHPR